MESMLSVNPKRSMNKQPKNKKKPPKPAVKVVYISNPMRVKTSASRFKALVQELTGQDAADLPDPAKFPDIESGRVGGILCSPDPEEVSAEESSKSVVAEEEKEEDDDQPPIKVSSPPQVLKYDDDDVFKVPELIENFPGLVSLNFCLEAAQFDQYSNSPNFM